MRHAFNIVLLLTLTSLVKAQAASTPPTCQQAHDQSVLTCSAHEGFASIEALNILGPQSRVRALEKEESRLLTLQKNCKIVQSRCAQICDEEVELRSLNGDDITQPINYLSECRQGDVAKELVSILQKIGQIKKMHNATPQPEPIGRQNAANL
jgi:hypothetical protein